ncbi:MAG: ankyrin repeat domain-containing protein [Bacteroidota bacterium]
MIALLLKSSIVLVTLLAFYKFVLEKESFFTVNRGYLLACLGLTFLLPFIALPRLVEHQGILDTLFVNKKVTKSVATNDNYIEEAPITTETFTEVGSDTKLKSVEQNDRMVEMAPSTTEKTVTNPKKEIVPHEASTYTLSDWLLMLYFFGVVVFSLNLLFQIAGMVLKIVRNDDKIPDDDGITVNLNEETEPCSFFQYIFINPTNYDFETYEQIIAHEKIHVAKGHTWDLLLAELAVVVLWFNPFVWLFRKEVEKNIEYQTDALLVYTEPKEREVYQMNLLKIATYNKPLTVVTNYNQSLIKQRILKMNSKKSNPYSYWKYAFMLPLIFMLLLILNQPKIAVANIELPPKEYRTEDFGANATADASTNQPSETPLDEPSKTETLPSKEISKKAIISSTVKDGLTDCERLLAAAKANDLEKVTKILTEFNPACMPYGNERDYENMQLIHNIAQAGSEDITIDLDDEVILVDYRQISLINHDYKMPKKFGNQIKTDCGGILEAIQQEDEQLVKQRLLSLDEECIVNNDDEDELADLMMTKKILRNGGDVKIFKNSMIIDMKELVVDEKEETGYNNSTVNQYQSSIVGKSAPADCKKLVRAVRAGDAALVKNLLESVDPNCIDPNPDYEEIRTDRHHYKNMQSATALVAAAKYGHLEIGKMLVKAGADVNHHSRNDASPLMAAAEKGHLNFVKYLLKSGADIDEMMQGYGTALGAAARNGQVEVVTYLLDNNADVNLKNNGQGDALNGAARHGNVEIVEILLANGANINQQTNGQGSALNAAARHGYADVLEVLIKNGADLDISTNGQGSALNAAARHGHLEIVQFLIDKGANINEQTNGQGSALNAAARHGHLDIIEFLTQQENLNIDLSNNGQGSALNAATRHGHLDIVKFLVKKGANVNEQTNGQGSALNTAARHGHLDIIEYLLKQGADINLSNNGQGSALNAAARHGHLDIVKFLVKKGADVNEQTNGQGTALLQAARNGNYDIVDYLLKEGADPNLGNAGQESLMEYARERGDSRLTDILRQ